jgi:hypothetical protein
MLRLADDKVNQVGCWGRRRWPAGEHQLAEELKILFHPRFKILPRLGQRVANNRMHSAKRSRPQAPRKLLASFKERAPTGSRGCSHSTFV